MIEKEIDLGMGASAANSAILHGDYDALPGTNKALPNVMAVEMWPKLSQELQDPRRMVAFTVRVKGGLHSLVPVYTRKAFPKPLIPQLAQVLRQVEVPAPVEINQVVLEDALGTGIDVEASRDMPTA